MFHQDTKRRQLEPHADADPAARARRLSGVLRYREPMPPLPHRPTLAALVRRLARNGAIVGGLIAGALAIGAAGYHYLDGLPWLDATLNAAMILTGMGPVDRMGSASGKLFAIVYSLFSAVFFLTMVAVLLAPAVQHFLHRFHLELDERREAGRRSHASTAGHAAATLPVVTACSLPAADRAQRTADFRSLLADTFIDRGRTAHGVRWLLRADAHTEAESHRLAALEARCCDGVRFDVQRIGDRVLWDISGPVAAQATLDAFHELPLLVRSDDGARRLWDALDGAACGPPAASRSPAL
jgi:hypothetical protein